MLIKVESINPAPRLIPTHWHLTLADRWDHMLARLGWRRAHHRVEPGLYALGDPTPDSPVFVTANYSLSFDALRSSLPGVNALILVLDTRGINVWCAAGKGTFSTEEIVRQVYATGLHAAVRHRRLILPQLGAPGVAAHLVKKQTGFRVEYGPVRAEDLLEYLKTHEATPGMRQVHFDFLDRLTVIPVDLTATFLPTLIAAVVLFFLGGWIPSLAVVLTVLAGVMFFPILLPWLPTQDFSTKGLILGGLVALPFALSPFLRHPEWAWWQQTSQALQFLLIMPAVTAFISLNFTGSTTFTSRSGVRREIFAYIPVMAWMSGIGLLLMVISFIV